MTSECMGKKQWLVPDCELPPEGEGLLKGHESVIVVNDSGEDAEIEVKFFFEDRESVSGIRWHVGSDRVRCFRMNKPEDMDGFVVPLETQYAMKIVSSCPVVIQYGRLDNRQTNLAYYTTMAYAD